MSVKDLTAAVAKIASDVTTLTGLVEKSIRSGVAMREATEAEHYAQLLTLIGQPQAYVSMPATIRSMAGAPASLALGDAALEHRGASPTLAGMAKLVLDLTHQNLGLVLYASEVLAIEQTDLYDGLVRMLKDRRKALTALRDRPEDIETASAEQIHGLADAYEELMTRTEEFRRQVAAFIVGRPQPEEQQGLTG